jgi:hypothetical protein
MLAEVIPCCRTICNKELEQHGLQPLKLAEFMLFVRLKSQPLKLAEFMLFVRLKLLDGTTAWRWLKQLGFTYLQNEKCHYSDGHDEKAENVRCRLKFIIRCFEHELPAFCWVQLTEARTEALEELEKRHSKKSLGHFYLDDDGRRMREFHVDCQDVLLDPETAVFGGNMWLRFPPGMRPLIIFGQDEMITSQFLFSAKSWKGLQQGEALILPMGEGEGIMVSAFILGELCLDHELTDDQLTEINRRFRTGKEDMSTEEAISLLGAAAQMRQMTVHRSMMDSDTARIDKEVELSALKEGLTNQLRLDDKTLLALLRITRRHISANGYLNQREWRLWGLGMRRH